MDEKIGVGAGRVQRDEGGEWVVYLSLPYGLTDYTAADARKLAKVLVGYAAECDKLNKKRPKAKKPVAKKRGK